MPPCKDNKSLLKLLCKFEVLFIFRNIQEIGYLDLVKLINFEYLCTGLIFFLFICLGNYFFKHQLDVLGQSQNLLLKLFYPKFSESLRFQVNAQL